MDYLPSDIINSRETEAIVQQPFNACHSLDTQCLLTPREGGALNLPFLGSVPQAMVLKRHLSNLVLILTVMLETSSMFQLSFIVRCLIPLTCRILFQLFSGEGGFDGKDLQRTCMMIVHCTCKLVRTVLLGYINQLCPDIIF